MSIELQKSGSTLVIKLPETLNASIQTEFRQAYYEKDIKEYVIDFARTEYVDSSGLGLLMLLHGTTKDYPSPPILKTTHVKDKIKDILKLSKVDKYFEGV